MKIICFGDSNTYGYDPRSYFGGRYDAADRWVDLIAEQSGGTVINAGENGREIPRQEWEFHQLQMMIHGQKPVDLLLIMLGTNDLLQGSSVESISDRMEYFVNQIPMKKNQILLIAPPHMKSGAWVESKTIVDASIQLDTQYEKLAQHLGIRFINAGKWNIPIAFDGVHFTAEGHRQFAEKLCKHLNALNGNGTKKATKS